MTIGTGIFGALGVLPWHRVSRSCCRPACDLGLVETRSARVTLLSLVLTALDWSNAFMGAIVDITILAFVLGLR